MDRIYRSQKHFYDATRKYYLLGRDELIAALDPPVGGYVLEMACGTGRNLIQIAKTYPGVNLFGADISREMLDTAANSVKRHQLEHDIKLVLADATETPKSDEFPSHGFERIIFSYSLSMIPDWRRAIRIALQALEPEGELHIVDFGQQRELPTLFRRALHGWLSRFHVAPRDELITFVTSLEKQGGYMADCRSLYRDYAWHIVIRKR